jgi:hypothetical protein
MILAQAAARGEISADRDWSLVADVVLAMGLLQVVRVQSVDAKFVRQVIDACLARGADAAHRGAQALKSN